MCHKCAYQKHACQSCSSSNSVFIKGKQGPINNGDLDAKPDSGHTRLYQWNNTAWIQLGGNIYGEASSDNASRWAISMNALGDRVAIGAYYNDPTALLVNAGHTRIYQQQFSIKIGSYILYFK